MAYVLTLILCFVIFFQPGVFFPALTKFRPLFLVAVLALTAWVLSPKSANPLKPKPYLSYFIIGFVAAQSISVFQYFYLPEIITTTQIWANFALVYFLVLSQADSEKRLRRVWIVSLMAISWLIMQAIWVYHTQDPLHPQLVGGRLSSYGAYSGANDLALIVVCTWPIVFKFTDLIKNRLFKLLPVPLLMLLVYADMRTVSRAGLLGLAMVMGLSMWRSRSMGKMGRWALVIPAILVVFMAGSKLLGERKDVQGFGGQDESMQRRIDAWYAGMTMLKISPLYGVGSGYFVQYSDEYGAGHAIQAHNTLVKVAAETGLIGLACYVGLLFMAFRGVWRAWRGFSRFKPDGPEVLWAEAIGIALIGFCFNTQFSVKAHEWLLYIMVASASSLERLYLRESVLFALRVESAENLLTGSGTKPA